MSKELDNELDGQLDLHDSDLSEEFEDDDEIVDEDRYDSEEEDDDDEDLSVPSSGMPLYVKAGLGIAAVSATAVIGAVGYFSFAGSSESQNVDLNDYSTQPAPNAISNMAEPIELNIEPAAQPAPTNNVDSLGLDLGGQDLLAEPSPVIAPVVAPVVEPVAVEATLTEEDVLQLKQDIETELAEKYEDKFNASVATLTATIEERVASKLVSYNSSNEQYASGIAELQSKIEKLGDIKDTASTEDINKIKSELSSKLTLQRLTESEKSQITRGRTRLGGFMVLTASLDGNMAIVRTPTDRVNVFFDGETFSNAGRIIKVDSIEDHGYLVLVGSKYFIDEEYSERKVERVVKAPAKKVVKPKPVKVKPAPAPTVKVDSTKVESRVYRAESINKRKVAVGWLKSGEYSKGYLVSNPAGEWSDIKLGDEVPTLGRVTGEDFDGNLIVGDYVILASE